MGILFERKENKNTNNSRKNREELQQSNDKVCVLFYSFASHLFAAAAFSVVVVVVAISKCIYREAFGTINANWYRHRDIKYESPECIESDPHIIDNQNGAIQAVADNQKLNFSSL